MIHNPDFELQRNLQFCFYYKGEVENPYHPDASDETNDAGFAWMSESIAYVKNRVGSDYPLLAKLEAQR